MSDLVPCVDCGEPTRSADGICSLCTSEVGMFPEQKNFDEEQECQDCSIG